MSFWILIVLALIQATTEFLPVSSSGHLVLLYNFFGIENNTKLLSILLHISTLLSVLIFYRKELWCLIKKPFCKTNLKILVTTIFTCLVVLILKPFIDKTFSGDYLFVFFIITAILLFVSDYIADKNKLMTKSTTFDKNYDITNMSISFKQAIIIGVTQGIACIPGISRSGSTIAVSRMIGVNDSARYSFLISIPIIIASFVMEIFEGNVMSLDINIIYLIIAMIVCFVVGFLCIKIMTKLVEKNKLIYFSYYLILLSVVLILIEVF